MAFQMGFIVFGGAFGGVKLDEYLNLQFPIFTLIFSIAGVAIAMYLSLKDLNKK